MNFDGDPKILLDGSGSTVTFTNGQPEMSDGLENSVLLSMFGGESYWVNSIVQDSKIYNSKLNNILRSTITAQTLIDAKLYAEDSLKWLIDDGIADKVTVTVSIPEKSTIVFYVEILQPNSTIIKYQINWAAMADKAGLL